MSRGHPQSNFDLLYGPPWIWALAVVVVVVAHCIFNKRNLGIYSAPRRVAQLMLALVTLAPLVSAVVSFVASEGIYNYNPLALIVIIIPLLFVSPQNLLLVPMYIGGISASTSQIMWLLAIAVGFHIVGAWYLLNLD